MLCDIFIIGSKDPVKNRIRHDVIFSQSAKSHSQCAQFSIYIGIDFWEEEKKKKDKHDKKPAQISLPSRGNVSIWADSSPWLLNGVLK
jgi:hypothetical protein